MRQKAIVDLTTGELSNKTRRRKEFVKLNHKLYFALVQEVSNSASVVAAAVLCFADYENRIDYTQNEFAAKIGMKEKTFMGAMVELQEKDFIRNVGHGKWMLNPDYAVWCEESYKPVLVQKYRGLRPYKSKKKNGGSPHVVRQNDENA